MKPETPTGSALKEDMNSKFRTQNSQNSKCRQKKNLLKNNVITMACYCVKFDDNMCHSLKVIAIFIKYVCVSYILPARRKTESYRHSISSTMHFL